MGNSEVRSSSFHVFCYHGLMNVESTSTRSTAWSNIVNYRQWSKGRCRPCCAFQPTRRREKLHPSADEVADGHRLLVDTGILESIELLLSHLVLTVNAGQVSIPRGFKQPSCRVIQARDQRGFDPTGHTSNCAEWVFYSVSNTVVCGLKRPINGIFNTARVAGDGVISIAEIAARQSYTAGYVQRSDRRLSARRNESWCRVIYGIAKCRAERTTAQTAAAGDELAWRRVLRDLTSCVAAGVVIGKQIRQRVAGLGGAGGVDVLVGLLPT